MTWKYALLSAVLLGAANVGHAELRETASERRFSLTTDGPAVTMPSADWVLKSERQKPDGQTIYYRLINDKAQLVLSLYIDKTETCSSAPSCTDSALRNPAYKAATDQRRFDVGPFDVATFYLDQPRGLPLVQANLVASAYKSGHWIDVHITRVSAEKPEMNDLVELLRNLKLN